ncbi:PAAR domain-containing protein [Pseudomonas syringae]
MIADGSTTSVFINGHPAARKGNKVTCGAKIGTGSITFLLAVAQSAI